MYEKLLSWLQSKRDFKEGLALYRQFSKNRPLIARFERLGDIPYHRDVLLNEIVTHCKGIEADARPRKPGPPQAMRIKPRAAEPAKPKASLPGTLSLERQTTIPAPPPAPPPREPRAFSPTDLALLPAEVQKVHIEKAQLFAEASRLHNVDLVKARSDEERAVVAENIMQKMTRNNELWEAWRHYEKQGKLPPGFVKPPVSVDDPLMKLSMAQLIQRRNNRRTNISQYKKWVEANDENHPKMKDKIRKLDEWNEELARINDLIEKGG